MLKLILWILMGYGMTSIIVWGSIFDELRKWIETKSKFFGGMINCMLCTATWVGFFLSICLGGLVSRTFNVHWFAGMFFDGMLTAGSVWIINSIVEFFEESRIK